MLHLNSKVNHTQSGFSLVEAMVATIVVGIGFIGVYSIAVFSETSFRDSVTRQKLQTYAEQMMDVIEADQANIDQYNLDFSTCDEPDVTETETYHLRRYEWCQRMNDKVGEVDTNDDRSISVTTLADGTNRKLVTILLEAGDENVQVVLKRVFEE